MKKNNEDKKKTRGQQKTWDVNYVRGKYNLNQQQVQEVIKACLKPGKHLEGGRIKKIGLIEIGKYMKANPLEKPTVKPNKKGVFVELLHTTVSKPPNRRKLWVYRMEDNGLPSEKMLCNVKEQIWENWKPHMPLECERISEGLYVFPPHRDK